MKNHLNAVAVTHESLDVKVYGNIPLGKNWNLKHKSRTILFFCF